MSSFVMQHPSFMLMLYMIALMAWATGVFIISPNSRSLLAINADQSGRKCGREQFYV